MHSAVDDHSRYAYSETLPDERGTTAAGFIERAAEAFTAAGIDQIAEILTDNALSYRNSAAVAAVVADLGVTHRFIKPHCPWQNGKVERFHRTMLTEWAYRQPWSTNQERAQALDTWLKKYNHTRPHTAPSADNHPPADCHQPDGRVHLAASSGYCPFETPRTASRCSKGIELAQAHPTVVPSDER